MSAPPHRLPHGTDDRAGDAPQRSATAAPTPLTAGTVVAGFAVQDIVGVDGGWTVVRAVPAATRDAPVTLWISAPDAAADPAVREHVHRLAGLRAARDVPHLPLVVPVAAKRSGDRLLLVWPTVPGTTLAERLRDGPLALSQAVRLISQIAGALDTLHAFGVPHDAVTPERVLLTERRPTEAVLLPDTHAATPPSHEADVEGLAALLRGCLGTEVPPALEAVLAQADSTQPRRRHRSATAFARSVQRVAGRQRPRIVSTAPGDDPAMPAPPAAGVARRARTLRARLAATALPRPSPPAHWRTPSRSTIALLLAAAATAGFAIAVITTDQGVTTPQPPPATTTPTPGSVADRATTDRPAADRALAASMRRLDAARVSGRRALAAARTPAAQARAASGLASAYAVAARTVPAADRLLAAPLRRAQTGYTRLAAAARADDAAGFRAAAATVTAAERDVAAALARGGG